MDADAYIAGPFSSILSKSGNTRGISCAFVWSISTHKPRLLIKYQSNSQEKRGGKFVRRPHQIQTWDLSISIHYMASESTICHFKAKFWSRKYYVAPGIIYFSKCATRRPHTKQKKIVLHGCIVGNLYINWQKWVMVVNFLCALGPAPHVARNIANAWLTWESVP